MAVPLKKYLFSTQTYDAKIVRYRINKTMAFLAEYRPAIHGSASQFLGVVVYSGDKQVQNVSLTLSPEKCTLMITREELEREKMIELIATGQQGDQKALNSLFNLYYNDVYYFAMKTLRDEKLAYDITQETFIRIIQSLREQEEPAAFQTWIRQITYHQCTHYFKRKRCFGG